MSSLPLIETRPKIAHQAFLHYLLVIFKSHICIIGCTLVYNHTPCESLERHGLKSFIDLSEQLRQKYVGQAALMHAAVALSSPQGL